MPTLTVFMPNFNQAALLPRAVEAVLAQDRQPEQFIIVDDGSTDGSADLLRAYAQKHPLIELHALPRNQGVAAAMALALEQARGDYFYGAASDDEVLPGYFAHGMRALDNHPTVGIVFGRFHAVDAAGLRSVPIRPSLPEGSRALSAAEFLDYLDHESPSASFAGATWYRTDAARALGGFPAELGAWCDTFVARALGLSHGAYFIDHACMNWTVQATGWAQFSTQGRAGARRIVDGAAAKMRQDRYRAIFPEAHVARWESRYRLEALGDLDLVNDEYLRRKLGPVREAFLRLAAQSPSRVDRAAAWLMRSMDRLAPWLGLADRPLPKSEGGHDVSQLYQGGDKSKGA